MTDDGLTGHCLFIWSSYKRLTIGPEPWNSESSCEQMTPASVTLLRTNDPSVCYIVAIKWSQRLLHCIQSNDPSVCYIASDQIIGPQRLLHCIRSNDPSVCYIASDQMTPASVTLHPIKWPQRLLHCIRIKLKSWSVTFESSFKVLVYKKLALSKWHNKTLKPISLHTLPSQRSNELKQRKYK